MLLNSMKNFYWKYLASNRLTAILFIIFPTSMALGTFIESWYSTDTAKIWIYNAWWFELIMFLFVINFVGNIFKYKLFRRNKLAILGLHLSFILILVGAFVTRYIGYEGVMPIREGDSTSKFLSDKTYLTVLVDGEIEGKVFRKKIKKELLLSEHVQNDFDIEQNFKDIKFNITYMDFMENVTEDLVLDPDGYKYIKIVEAIDGTRHNHYIKEGEVSNIHNVLFTLNNPIKGAINIEVIDGEYFLTSPFKGSFLRMADQYTDNVVPEKKENLQFRSLYTISNYQFVIPEPVLRGKFDVVKLDQQEDNFQDMLKVRVGVGGESKEVNLLGGKGFSETNKKVSVGPLDFYMSYGSVEMNLPFEIKLNDFIAEKYPGTENSYSSFESKITVMDNDNFDYRIYMNHVLDHKGYRFFQSSFDPDEKGTILSVNHDKWGTILTYSGYMTLYASMIGIFFLGKTRFKLLSKKIEKIKHQKSMLSLLILLVSQFSFAQDTFLKVDKEIDYDSIIIADAFPHDQAEKFGSLIIQDLGGRMKPANTFSSELVRKVSKKDEYKGLNSDQVLLSILNGPAVWFNTPIIYLKRGNDSIRKLIGVPMKTKYAPLVSFFDKEGNYKISSQLEKAYRAGIPNQFQKDFIEVDKRVNLLYSALEGKVLRIFPVPGDKNNKWVSYPEIQDTNFTGPDSLYVNNVLPLYFQSLRSAKKSGDYTNATNLLESLKGYQKRYGEMIVPSDSKIKSEILYNKYDVFKKIFSWYLYAGLFLFLILIIQIFNQKKVFVYLINFFKAVVYLLFVLHTAGLIFRAYISGHAPWSDAYESMIYVSWATMLFGILFGRKSNLTLAATTFVVSMILMIAHWNWMDPSIANLQPVLDSYWLMIHVAVIVGSYGPFALSMIIGLVVLLLMVLTNRNNKKIMNLNINELSIVNELSMTVGLIMLTIGNFLGGMWANESWGRYWGWDPKETWALISIMVYAFVIHMRFIPSLRGKWIFNLASIVSFASILMTYFGVNFYLVGLHSYASGDKIITPNFVYYSIALVALLATISYFPYKKYYLKLN